MAVRVIGTGSRASKISGATSYDSIISRYASQIQNALQSELQAEREAVILAYKAGSMSWDDVKAFFEQKIIGSPEGSMDRVKYQQDLVDLQKLETERVKNNKRAELEAKFAEGGTTPAERYQIESEMLGYETPGTDAYVSQQQKTITAFENAETQRIMQLKSRLISDPKYATNGITPQEELQINQILKSEANPDSQIYNTLVNEEQSIRERLDTYLKGQGQENLSFNSRDKLAQLAADEAQSDINYQQGLTTGYERDKVRLDNAKEAYQILQDMSSAGISVSLDLLEQAKTNFMKAQNLLGYRDAGYVFDVVTNEGNIEPVTITGKNPFTGVDVKYKDYPIQLNPTTGYYDVIDPSTGTKMTSYVNPQGKQVSLQALTQKAAQNAADEMGITSFNVVFPGENGMATTKQITQDKETGVFYDSKDPTKVYLKVPQSSGEAASVLLQNVPADWRTNAAVKAQITDKASQFATKPNNADLYNLDMSISQTTGETPAQQKSFWENFKDAYNFQNEQKLKIGEGIYNAGESVVKGVGETLAPAAKKIGEVATDIYSKIPQGVKSAAKSIFTPSVVSNPIGLNFPANLGNNFKMPEFSMPEFRANWSAPASTTKNTPATGINLPKVDFLGGIKKLTQGAGNVLSGIGTGVSNLWKSTVGRLF